MENYIFQAPTKVYFGKDQIKNLPDILSNFGKNVLLTYGGGSIKKNGIYDRVQELLKDFNVFELPGIEPNPRIKTVEKGAEICKANNIDVILAVGGGSTIDCSKVISAATYYDGNPWDLVIDSSKITKTLPLVTILTLAATGSEMNSAAVISNTEKNEKIGTHSPLITPKVSILDPEYTYTVPAYQTAAGSIDIMSHVIENYFNSTEGTYIPDRFAESLLKTVIKYCPVALIEPTNYEARANLMWASSMALFGIIGTGKKGSWTCHSIEHVLSAFYDITHGVGLAIITPRWMRHILSEQTVNKFVEYAINVWNVDPTNKDNMEIAKEGIQATEDFFNSCGIPMNLGKLGIDDSLLDKMAHCAYEQGHFDDTYVKLTEEDIAQILRDSL